MSFNLWERLKWFCLFIYLISWHSNLTFNFRKALYSDISDRAKVQTTGKWVVHLHQIFTRVKLNTITFPRACDHTLTMTKHVTICYKVSLWSLRLCTAPAPIITLTKLFCMFAKIKLVQRSSLLKRTIRIWNNAIVVKYLIRMWKKLSI